MSVLIAFFTGLLVLNALFLILLVLLQLPKKDAGAGVAFGGGTTDALFGAGAGNILTHITKYATAIFLGLSLITSVLTIREHERSAVALDSELERQEQEGGGQPESPGTEPSKPEGGVLIEEPEGSSEAPEAEGTDSDVAPDEPLAPNGTSDASDALTSQPTEEGQEEESTPENQGSPDPEERPATP